LPEQIGLGAFLDGGGDGDHALVAGGGFEHLAAGESAIEHSDRSTGDGDEHDGHELSFPVVSRAGRSGPGGERARMCGGL
jgi:hypothetical protein